MNKIEQIKAEIERRHKYQVKQYHDTKPDGRPNDGWAESLAIMGELEELLSFIESLPEEKPSEDLEQAAYRYSLDSRPSIYGQVDVIDAFIAGAHWQKEQFEKNRLAACDAQTEEEYEWETAFATEIIEKEHRSPTFNDAINYGMRLQKEQMMKEAVEGVVEYNFDENGKGYYAIRPAFVEETVGTKMKIIIIKED